MKTNTVLKLFFITIIFSPINLLAQTDWLMASYNPQRTNYVAEETELSPPFEIEQNIKQWCESLVKKDNIFYLGNGGDPNTLVAYNYTTQQELWKFELEGSGGSLSFIPAISGDKIFFGGQNGKGLFAFDRMTGEQKWFRDLGSLFRKNPILDNKGHIFISNSSNQLSCLNENTGETIWNIDASGYLTPTYNNDKIFVSTYNKLVVLNSKTGEVIWKRNHSDGSSGHILIDETGAYLCVTNTIACYVPDNGAEKWYYQLPNTLLVTGYDDGAACLTDSVLCVSLVNNSYTKGWILAINKFTGEKMWEFSSKYTYIKGPVAANGIVYTCAEYKPWIAGFKQTTGEMVFQDTSQLYWGMIIADHKLYAYSSGGITVFKNKTSSTTENNLQINNFKVFPNPSRDEIHISYSIKEKGYTQIGLRDISGKKVKTIYKGINTRGNHKINYNIPEFNPGIYFLVLKNNKNIVVKKIVVMGR